MTDNPNPQPTPQQAAEPQPATEKWTEIEHLPEWDEEFYHVYTAKKHGKWVMLKTLRPEFKDDPECREMMGREFDARYNLAHPNILMINDFEEVPGIGLCIITDDVYGDSLRKLIDKGAVTEHHIEQLRDRLPAALQYIQDNRVAHHALRPETIIFTENIGNLKLIDVGFEQRPSLTPNDTAADLVAYGNVVLEALKACQKPHPSLRRAAERASNGSIKSLRSLQTAIHGATSSRIYVAIIAFLVLMVGLLLFLNSPLRPTSTATVNTEIAQ